MPVSFTVRRAQPCYGIVEVKMGVFYTDDWLAHRHYGLGKNFSHSMADWVWAADYLLEPTVRMLVSEFPNLHDQWNAINRGREWCYAAEEVFASDNFVKQQWRTLRYKLETIQSYLFYSKEYIELSRLVAGTRQTKGVSEANTAPQGVGPTTD